MYLLYQKTDPPPKFTKVMCASSLKSPPLGGFNQSLIRWPPPKSGGGPPGGGVRAADGLLGRWPAAMVLRSDIVNRLRRDFIAGEVFARRCLAMCMYDRFGYRLRIDYIDRWFLWTCPRGVLIIYFILYSCSVSLIVLFVIVCFHIIP